jgi:hypothetical protein
VKRAAWLVVLVALACGVPTLWAQRSDTIYQTIFTNITAPTASAAVHNIGQNIHLLSILFTSQSGHTCSAPAPNIGIEGGFNGTQYTRVASITSISPDDSGNLAALVTGLGAFPFVRINARGFDTTNCQLSAWYSGSLGGQSSMTVTATAQFSSTTFTVIDFASSGDHTIVTGQSSTGIVIYEFLLWNASLQDIRLKSGSTLLTGPLLNFCSLCGMILPFSGGPHMTLASGNSFVINTSGTTQVSGYVRYRYE